MLEGSLYIAFGIAFLVGAMLLAASRRPDTFHAVRTKRIAAPPERLFPLIDDLRQMNTWNPYALRETSGTGNYRGPDRGVGATFEFAGRKSGTGDIAVTESVPNSKVVLRLRMFKPFKADNRVEFTLVPVGAETDVTWAMSGRQPLLAKCMAMIIDCDGMIGRDFEEGLANLEAKAKAG